MTIQDLEYIQQIERELKSYKAEICVAQKALENARQELETIKRERDELLSDLKKYGCYTCEHYECDNNEMPCANCEASSLWERMGACPENTEARKDG